MLRSLLFGAILYTTSACSAIEDHLGAAAEPGNSTEIIVEIPKGTTAGSLGSILAKAGVIDSADNFKNYIRLTKKGGCLKAGKFSLSRADDAEEILKTVCGVPLANDKPFTIVEGWRIREIDAALAKKGWIKAGEYSKLANDPSQLKAPFDLPTDNLEGYLFPETFW